MIKKTYLASFFILFSSGLIFGQANESLTVKTSFFSGIKFEHNGNNLNFDETLSLVDQNEQAATYLRMSKNQATTSTIVGAIGGFFIGWPVGTAIGGGEPNWNLFYVGAGIAVISIPIYNSAVKNARRGVNEYNSGLATLNSTIQNQLTFTITSSGAGLKFSF
ncbi:hypothetical protein A8B79_05165 [Balneola sp. EhC07]|uniref:hypothetical protein n=1 Tax=Balneola sp. EhC07 TaxID=1849360 RepID=UPI0007F3630A|nr:hypothetical protein [Balneola sp. EhC07]OAN61812.1 hypothetical protein A8B79_05165 [Balneola sp. EhC07]